MGNPAARVNDPHVCPMITVLVPHLGGPVMLGSPNVITGGMPQSRIGDLCLCVGPPDAIAMGSMTVIVNGMFAARVGDVTVHGGTIMMGMPTVLIGG